MAAMKTGRWRRLWLNVHLWIGVGLLLALAPLGLSGSALVWDGPLDRMLHPARVVAAADRAALGPTAYLATAQTAFGDRARANQLRWPARPGEPVVVSGRLSGAAGGGGPPRTLNAWVDPATGRVLDIGDPRASLIGTLHRLHGNLLLPGNGRAVVGWLGWAMAASCLTGLWLWWPRGNWLAGLGWRRGPHAWSDLHHMAGFWICIPLFVLSITGVYIAFPKASHALVGAPPPAASGGAGEARAVGEGRPAGPARMTADAALAAALS
ncbi:MAG: PepSY domain-containing protein, partial [Proteobacteria bacterium]|nr:PepSY domain-containing protein [Pseudomonadota bacterium]